MRQPLIGAVTSLVAALACLRSAVAYIPAVPTNDTSAFTQSDDLLHLAYYNGPFSVYTSRDSASANVARQLLAEGFGDDGNYTNTTTIVPWTRYSKGVLLHFDETLRNQPPAAVPWLAMINCDTNGTSFSDVDDIFTICRDLGAQAALLYSLTSQGCEINAEYLTYEKVLDVYATTTLQNARIIENQFGNVNSSAWHYSSEALNSSATLIDALLANNALSVVGNIPVNASSTDAAGDSAQATAPSVFDPDNDNDNDPASSDPASSTSTVPPSLFSGTSGRERARRFAKRQAVASSTSAPPSSTRRAAASTTSARSTRTTASPSPTVAINYLGAVIAARNLTVGGLNNGTAPSPTPSGQNNKGPNSGLAMIILYAITGVVTFLFFTVIACGAARAIRHPERYGPRSGFGYGNRGSGPDGNGGAQNRAQGLARAVLDTFPVVRFGGGSGAADTASRRDEENGNADEDGKKVYHENGDQVELTRLAPVLSPVPRPQGQRTDTEQSREETEEIALVSSRGGSERQPRKSVSTSSFQSAVSTPALAAEPVDHSLAPDTTRDHELAPPIPVPGSIDLPLASPFDSPASALSPVVPSTVVSQLAPESVSTPTGDDESEQPSCPICVCDFVPGDSIRILPCDGRHQFHVECIDPWLLGVSRLCPLCRLDLGENRDALAREADDEAAREAREREREQHEEERVVRHLRGLLHRGSSSSTATAGGIGVQTGGGGGGGRSLTEALTGSLTGRRRANTSQFENLELPSTSDGGGARVGLDAAQRQERRDEMNGLRSRFANYVATKRTRRRASTSTGADRPRNSTAQ
ncbi:hypothetical protein JCM10212_006294 [Sporobolomyces blumeae]